MAGMERAFAIIADDQPDEDLAALAARLGLATGTAPTSSARPSAWRSRWTSQRRTAYPTAWSSRSGERPSRAPRAPSRSPRRSSSVRLQLALDHDVLDERACATSAPDICFRRDAYDDALAIPRRVARARTDGDRPSRIGRCSPNARSRLDAGSLGRGTGDARRVHPGAIDSGGMMLSLLESSVDPDPARRARAPAQMLSMFSRLRGSTDAPGPVLATSDLGPRCSGAEGRPRRGAGGRRGDHRGGPYVDVAAQSEKQGIVEGSKRPWRSGRPRRSRSSSSRSRSSRWDAAAVLDAQANDFGRGSWRSLRLRGRCRASSARSICRSGSRSYSSSTASSRVTRSHSVEAREIFDS